MTPILATKLYIPPPPLHVIVRPRLVERLNEGLHRKLTLISAAAGFGKTTVVSEWVAGCGYAVAWLSLDEGDNDPLRFLTYLVAALQTIAPGLGEGVMAVLRSPQPPPMESILTTLLNDITPIAEHFVLVLDDYHLIDASPIDHALAFLLEHLPPTMHLVIATREDPPLPLARLRARRQLTELRVTDLRFTLSEVAGFLNQVMGLRLSEDDIAALETRTEGWIAGLQLAALSMQGQQDASHFIKSFTGSNRFVLDYLAEEVLHQQPAPVQAFLLRTSILERLCGPLCDAVMLTPSGSGQETLEYIERANLFIIPLDNERRWYRYHHLFGDLLRQRLYQSMSSSRDEENSIAELHRRASFWYEANGLDIEAFHHAVAGNDLEHAAHLVEGKGMPLIFRGAAVPVLTWLKSLPKPVMDERPVLWVIYASALLFISDLTGVEQKLQAAEAALQNHEMDDKTRDLIGHIASIRATLGVSRHDIDAVISQSHRALEYLNPHNLPVRTATTWSLGYAYQLQGDRATAARAYQEAITISESIGHFIIVLMASIGLGSIHETENQYVQALQIYQRILHMVRNHPIPVICEVHLGMARIAYEWNDLDTADQHAQKSLQLSQQIATTDRFVASQVFMARVKLAQGDISAAALILEKAEQLARQYQFMRQVPDIIAAQVRMLLLQGDVPTAAQLIQGYDLPLSQARVSIVQSHPSEALAVLGPFRAYVDARNWKDERLKLMVMQAVAHHVHGEKEKALQGLRDVLALAEPNGFIRLFVDEGAPMAQLLTEAAARKIMPDYVGKLLAAFGPEAQRHVSPSSSLSLLDSLSQRELEILQLIAQGLSNQEISERLFLSLNTVKGHNQRIFDKLQVQRRTEAVARARELRLI